jgi:inosine-uridine nucleoside N-ribohydrolase
MTLCDERDVHRRGTPNVEVLTSIDAEAAWSRLRDALAAYDAEPVGPG